MTEQSYPALIGVDASGIIGAAAASSASNGFFGNDGKLNLVKLNADKDYLVSTLRPHLKFINEQVLHIQKNPKAATPSGQELKEVIDKLKDILKKYRLFLTGSHVEWSMEDFSWGNIFSVPWLGTDN